MSKYDISDATYKFIGSIGRGVGTGLIITGFIQKNMETILGGIGAVYAGQCFYKSAQDNENARKQADILVDMKTIKVMETAIKGMETIIKGIEAKLKQ